jgi:glycosyltransferase involved in cell wall biosynthesis
MAARALLPYVRDFAPDLIFGISLYPDSYAAVQIGKRLSVPVIANSIGSDINRIGDRISARHTCTVLRHADFLLTKSDDLRAKALAMGADAEKTRTVPNGCDSAVFHIRNRSVARQQLRISEDAEAVVYIGRMDINKGLRDLVESVALLHRPNLHVYLVGSGPDKAVVELCARTNAVSDRVHFVPPCSFDEVSTWMTAANLVTLPSHMEGCPNVVLEALACGRPVVATNVGGIPEILSDEFGCLVPPHNPVALAGALESALNKVWDESKISAQRKRSWEDVASELLGIFEDVVSAREGVCRSLVHV